MAFGYCFKPSVARLATGWNELESNWLKIKIIEKIFWLGIKGEWEWSFIRRFNFFKGG